MAIRKTVDFQGRKVEAEVVNFEAKSEAWNQYVLEDGTALKMKLVLLDVARVLNEYTPTGDPVYIFTAQQIVGSTSPDALKKKANGK